MHPLVVVKGDHRPLPADEEQRVVIARVDVTKRLGVLDQRGVLGTVDEPQAEDVLGAVARFIARIAPRVRLEPSSVRTGEIDLIALVDKSRVRMRQLGPPEADGPPSGRRGRRVRCEDQYAPRLIRIDDVDLFTHTLYDTTLCR